MRALDRSCGLGIRWVGRPGDIPLMGSVAVRRRAVVHVVVGAAGSVGFVGRVGAVGAAAAVSFPRRALRVALVV